MSVDNPRSGSGIKPKILEGAGLKVQAVDVLDLDLAEFSDIVSHNRFRP